MKGLHRLFLFGGVLSAVWLAQSSALAAWPTADSTPKVDAAKCSAIGATHLVAAFETRFPASPASRNHNLQLCARKLNGLVLQPNQIFSFNDFIGPRTRERGFGEGRVFVGDRMVLDVGGGVCQVSTTLYNIALLSGLRVLQRSQHGMTVPYVPPGTDATVAYGYLDLVLQNQTGGPVLFFARSAHGTFSMLAYAERPGPRVEIHSQTLRTYPFYTLRIPDSKLRRGQSYVDSPGQVGVDARSWLVRYYNGNKEVVPLHQEHFRPSPRVIYVGTA